jgi:ATP-dependent helicase/nuclease subunit A
MTVLADSEARRRILTEFGSTFFAEAAAGTGKTTALVGRIVGLIRAGAATLDQIVAVTFTEKAAGEMKLRIRSEIERARAKATAEERARLDRALEQLELARLGTIHAFCGDLLRERPVEAAIDPLFEVAAESEGEALADEAFEAWFQRILLDPPEGVRRLLRRRSGRESPRERLRDAVHKLREHRDFPAAWRRDPFDRTGTIDRLMARLAELGRLAAESSRPQDLLTANLAEVARFVGETARLESLRGRDYDGLEADLRDLAHWRNRWDKRGNPKTTFGALSRDDVLARRDQAKAALDEFMRASDADLAPLLHQELQEPIADYQRLKTRAGRLDFLDLLIRARDLIRDNDTVRAELQRRFSHFFVDEFQDTDPLQAEILLLLAADDPREKDWHKAKQLPGKLFLVGDPKQSIYRFRRADVAIYETVKQRLLGAGAGLLHLTTSFRAPPSIQEFVNAAFAPAMTASPDGSQAAYVALTPFRPEITDQPTIVALPVPRPYGDRGNITTPRIEESYPDAVGAFVDWLVNKSGWTVEENGRRVPVCPRHIAILFRRLRTYVTDVTRPYVRALERRRIAHVLVGGRSFHECEEIIALRNALTAIEWPDDELKVYATLRGPFIALADEALLAFRQYINADGSLGIRRLHPMRPIDRETLPPLALEVADALELLRRLHIGRNHRPIAQTVTMLLEAVRAHAGIALWPTGEQALANCQRLVDMARQFEESASSFRAFIEKLERDSARAAVDEAPIIEEGAEGVRVMTVHKAKGLEFPVVILANPTAPTTHDNPSRHVEPARRLWLESICGLSPIELLEAGPEELQRDHAEAIRTAYVAGTRARDLLVAPVCGDERRQGWLDVLNPVLYPEEMGRARPEPAPGAPSFGTESVLERGPDSVAPQSGSVKPGLHRLSPSRIPVAWWDPSKLQLDVEEQAPLRHQKILEPDGGPEAAVRSERDYAAWSDAREALLADGSRPSLSVRTVTAMVHSVEHGTAGVTGPAHPARPAATGQAEVRIEVVEHRIVERPGGRRFGSLVHAMLASIELGAGAGAMEASAAINARLVGATDEERAAAIVTVTAALAHPIMRRAAASAAKGGLRRETPVLHRLEDGTLVEGVVDLAFREETEEFAGWTAVDFKTDREFAEWADRHVAQVGLYSRAIQAATASPARGVVLVI